jgi:hypothetical protein
LASSTKMAISRFSDFELKQSLWCWKYNSKIYKVMFHESFLIPMFTKSKGCPFTSRLNGLSYVSIFHCFMYFKFSYLGGHLNKGTFGSDGNHRVVKIDFILCYY